jgi:murein DD-endopeptidase MepM/ murein hydrolase activator NlpD
VTKISIIGILAVRMALPFPYISGVPIAEASILGDIQSFFSGYHASADITRVEASEANSQKMPLLEAPTTPLLSDPGSSDLPSNFSIINSALISSGNNSSESANQNKNASQNGDEITNYTVKSGDNVTVIAKKYGISVNTVLWANNLRVDSTLKVGQTLVILPISGINYTVKSGDTLQTVALKYKGDTQEIMAYNNMTGDKLKVGQTIVIPNGELGTRSDAGSKSKTSLGSRVANAALGVKIASADTSQATFADNYYMRPILAGVRTQGIHGHNAVDLADSCGTPIYASAAGKVTISMNDGKWNGGYGNYVVISHDNGSQTLYSHFKSVSVSAGTQVAQGDPLGLMGETGEATGCHVHFEIRNGISNPF